VRASIPNERDGFVSYQGAVLERRESDRGWFVLEEVTITDQAEVFKQGTFPEDVQHMNPRNIVPSVDTELEGAKVLE
jgi:hypothetical protein